ncbi:molybdate ABC transporter substrate-binding protein [Helicobacter winghamensis]|uniref:molybdate ABC transporter substrate-binding protein n=1 Tax=Helicobacter winghamensis TaxID=157268 RepID=UPI00242E9D5D|nr:molybdate ABC transporter substrate-binding protein [Helicobacter winghamensis]
MRIVGLLLAFMFVGVQSFAEVFIAAGAGYKKPLEAVSALYEKQSGKKVLRSYGNLQQVIEQAKQSGKIDAIFGDEKFIQKSKLPVKPAQLIGQGKLVLVASKSVELKSTKDLEKMNKIALPDAKKAIYGIAAMEFLKSANYTESLKDKLMFVATVPQVSTYLSQGSVEVGFINLTDYLANKEQFGEMIEILQETYSPILIVVAPLQDSKNPELADFMVFLDSEEAKEIFKEYGLEK